ncbi:MAG: helix-turn-helix domain-containing protein [Woeseiaceae bacterium]|nr:helix-turn-helix domain-containing protein [Woeseiaceae bacterium]
MSEELLGWVFGAAVAQGAFLVIALATLKVRNSNARWLLAAMLLVLTLTLGEEFLDVINLQFGVSIGLIAEFLMWPLLYLFVASLAEDDPRPLRTQWWHLVPTVFAIAWYLSIYLGAEDRWISLSNPETRHQVALTVLIKALFFSAYAWMILRRPLELAAKPLASRRALVWVRRWVWVLCGAYLFVLLSFLAFYLEFDWAVDSDYIGGLLMAVGIYSLGYFTLANRNVFDVRPRRRPEAEQGDKAADVAARARDYLTASNAFLDPDLGLKTLADALELNETRLSQALNQGIDGGFYALVNDLRLKACLALLDDPGNEQRTVLELAYEAGFSSKATFYRYFRARMGMTPKAYRAKS